MSCENLATKAELAALEQKLLAMLTAKLDKAEKQAIIDLATSGAVGIVGATLIPPVRAEASAAKSIAVDASAKAFNAGDIATRAADIAAVSRDVANGAAQSANVARQAANVAQKEAQAASALARVAQGTANIAKGAAEEAGKLARFVNGRIDNAIGYFTRIFNHLDGKVGGALSEIGKLAGRVADLLGKVLFILDLLATVAMVAQMMALQARVEVLERQQSLFNSELDRIQNLALRILDQVRQVEKNLSEKAAEALAKSIAAFNLGFKALSNSFLAQQDASRALKNSIDAAKNAAIASAVATAASVAVGNVLSRIPGIERTASNANSTANEALRRANQKERPIVNYIDRTVTNNYTTREFVTYRVEGRPGRDGLPGRPGRDGRDGKDVNPADLSEIKRMLYKIDGTTVKTNGTTTANLAISTTTNTKVGIIGTTLDKLNEFTQIAWKATRMDKALNVLNTVLLFHNAAMLSRSLAVTLGDTASTVLNAFGIRDEKNELIDVNAVIGKKVTVLAKTVLGAEVYDDLSDKWKAASRILSSASRMLDIIKSMIYSVINGLEVIGRWIALIGNGAQRDGLFSDGVFPWANEYPNFKNLFFNYIEGLERLEDAASSVNELASEVVEGKELIEELRKEKKTFTQELDKGAKEIGIKEEEEVKKSQNPAIKDEDLLEAQDDD